MGCRHVLVLISFISKGFHYTVAVLLAQFEEIKPNHVRLFFTDMRCQLITVLDELGFTVIREMKVMRDTMRSCYFSPVI
jgi:hypothetical protein